MGSWLINQSELISFRTTSLSAVEVNRLKQVLAYTLHWIVRSDTYHFLFNKNEETHNLIVIGRIPWLGITRWGMEGFQSCEAANVIKTEQSHSSMFLVTICDCWFFGIHRGTSYRDFLLCNPANPPYYVNWFEMSSLWLRSWRVLRHPTYTGSDIRKTEVLRDIVRGIFESASWLQRTGNPSKLADIFYYVETFIREIFSNIY